jgi:hypothetical protein
LALSARSRHQGRDARGAALQSLAHFLFGHSDQLPDELMAGPWPECSGPVPTRSWCTFRHRFYTNAATERSGAVPLARYVECGTMTTHRLLTTRKRPAASEHTREARSHGI